MFIKTDLSYIRTRDISAVYVSESKTMLGDGTVNHYWVDAVMTNGLSMRVSPYFKNNRAAAERFRDDFTADIILHETAEGKC